MEGQVLRLLQEFSPAEEEVRERGDVLETGAHRDQRVLPETEVVARVIVPVHEGVGDVEHEDDKEWEMDACVPSLRRPR